jgi:hypothetical protein
MAHFYYSQRKGRNLNESGLLLDDIVDLYIRVYEQSSAEEYFAEAFGSERVDAGHIAGNVRDIELEVLLAVRKKDLWPPLFHGERYSEDDLFDVIEFLYQHFSKPIDGSFRNYAEFGMHWETFNKQQGQSEYRGKVNAVLGHYAKRFELSENGEIFEKPQHGFERIFDADIPSSDSNVTNRINAAILRYRLHGVTLDDRRQAVRDLADVLEYTRPKIKSLLTSADEKDLFNLANNFGIRHHNDQQKTGYDASLWLSWTFYFYLATIHVVLRKGQQTRAGLSTGE